jgi:hypothetical protein
LSRWNQLADEDKSERRGAQGHPFIASDCSKFRSLIMSITHWRERSHFQTSQGPICNLRVTHNTAWREKVTWRPQEQPWSFAQRCINPCRSLCAAPKQKPRPNFTPRKTPPSHYLLLFIASIAAEKAILRCFTNAAIFNRRRGFAQYQLRRWSSFIMREAVALLQ